MPFWKPRPRPTDGPRLPEGTPRVIASDLDGTLLDPAGEVTARTRRALEAIWAAGIETVFVTARPPRWVDHLAHHAGAHGVAICANGAFVYDVSRREVTHATALPAHVVHAVAADLRAAIPGVGFAVELADGFRHERAYPELHPEWVPPGSAVDRIEDAAGQVGKLLARSLDVPGASFLLDVATVVGDRGIVANSGAGALAEIGPPGVTKASALARWCAARGLGADAVWAFGDMPNDIPMLRWAGASFAVAGAPPEVAAAATHACPGNADDGVATVLEALIRRGHA